MESKPPNRFAGCFFAYGGCTALMDGSFALGGIAVELVCEEQATYTQGTSEQSSTHVAARQPVAEAGELPLAADFELPADGAWVLDGYDVPARPRANRGSLREVLFELYDRWELGAVSRSRFARETRTRHATK